jgi:hypothetical protein
MKHRLKLEKMKTILDMRLYPMTKVTEVVRTPREPVYKPLHGLLCPRCFREIEQKRAYRVGKEYHCVHCNDDFIFMGFTNTEDLNGSFYYAYLTKVQ